MYQNHAPLFPQGLVAQYHYADFTIEQSVLENVEVGKNINNIIKASVKARLMRIYLIIVILTIYRIFVDQV